MSFVSLEFWLFFLIVFSLYWIAPGYLGQNIVLLMASIVFYGWLFNWHVIFLLIFIAIDYFLALRMARWTSKASILLYCGILFNIVSLVFIKYYFFFNAPLADWLIQRGLPGDIFFMKIILPLGVSFYTLKKISYLIDVRRGVLQPTRDFIMYAVYISFFPQVYSGPIERPRMLFRQLSVPRVWSSENFYEAWKLIMLGVFKKIVVANTVKVIVDQIFLMYEPSKVFLLVAGLGFTLQVLADFSSYTDLSRGIARLLGLETTENFNYPYLSLTPGEFWNRWHISFSSWLRDYIFFPLRRTVLRVRGLPEIAAISIPPLLTMLASGLWHGTGLSFVIWGLYYGVLIVVYQLAGVRGDWHPDSKPKRFAAWAVMFSLIVIGWLIFRSQSLDWLWHSAFHSPYYRTSQELVAASVLLLMIAFYATPLFVKYLLERFYSNHINLHALYYAGVVLLTVIFTNSSSPDFIYFQF